MEKFYKVGTIVNTQGLQGEVRVMPSTDFAQERFSKGSVLALFDDKDNYIQDLKSTNKTYLNGKEVKRKMRLKNGMKVRFGDVECEFKE